MLISRINHRWTSQKPETADFIINYDAWDGYQANRRRLLQHVYDNQIDNVFAVTGDTHANWLFENNLETTLQGSNDTSTLKTIKTTSNEYQRGTIVEFGGTAVSSSGWGNSWGSYENSTVGAKAMVENNPTLLYADGFSKSLRLPPSESNRLILDRGYMTLTVNYTHVETSWYEYPGNQQARVPDNRQLAMRAVVEAGMNQVQRPLQQPTFGAIKPGNF
jgi:alkaline phosphatase D